MNMMRQQAFQRNCTNIAELQLFFNDFSLFFLLSRCTFMRSAIVVSLRRKFKPHQQFHFSPSPLRADYKSINLTATDIVIFFDLVCNPTVNQQVSR